MKNMLFQDPPSFAEIINALAIYEKELNQVLKAHRVGATNV